MILHWATLLLCLIVGLDAFSCPKPWKRCGRYCHLVLKKSRLTWVAANNYCKRQHSAAQLLPFMNNAMMGTLKRVHPTFIWLGLTDRDEEGKYVFLSGQVDTHNKWIPQQPSDRTHTENCITVKKGKYFDNPCHEYKRWCPFVCSIHESKLQLGYPESIDCQGGVASLSGRCYKVIKSPMNRKTAEQKCSRIHAGAHLATVTSWEEFDSMALAIDREGLKKEPVRNYWVGLSRGCVVGAWRWEDGTPFYSKHLELSWGPPVRGLYAAYDLRRERLWFFDDGDELLPAVCSWYPARS